MYNYGPTFGGGHDLRVSEYFGLSSSSYSDLGQTYQPTNGK